MFDWIGDTVNNIDGWLDDAGSLISEVVEGGIDTVSGWIDEGIEWADDMFDAYIWDTGQDEAVLEAFVHDIVNAPEQEGVGYAGEIWDYMVDDFWFELAELEGYLDAGKDAINDVFDGPDKEGKDNTINTEDKFGAGFTTVVDKVSDFIADISLNLGTSFEQAMAAITGVGEMFKDAFMLDLDDYIDNGLKLYRLQKKLVERIAEEYK